VKRRWPPTIPPLGDAAIARVERGLFSALDARPLEAAPAGGARRRGVALALAGVAAAAAVFVVRETRRTETMPMSTRAAQISTTTSGSRISIAGATLDVAPQSAVSFGGRDGAVVVVLDRGTVTCEVAPRSNRAPFIVEAGATRVTVIGTKFSVHRVGDHASVSVEHGLVEVADTNMTELVHAGERYRPGERVTREPLASEAPAAAPAAEVTPPVAVPPAIAAVAPVAAAAPVATRAPEPRRARRLALAESAARALEAVPHARADAPEPAATPPEGDATTPEPAPAEADAPRGRSVQVLFELAAQLEVRDPEAALRIYGELAAAADEAQSGAAPDGASGHSWAASALFASARLEAERGRTARARELCAAYLERFPRGPNADDARTLLARAR
jgi:hypothetical protein